VAYQFHRPDLQAGVILAFRHAQCSYVGLIVAPYALNPSARYEVEWLDEKHQAVRRTMTGDELRNGLDLRLPTPGTSLVVRYRQVGA
jgi:hypothetical protein